MIIKGSRRGGARKLSAHLLRRDTNEDVTIRENEGYPGKALSDKGLYATLRLMEAEGRARGKDRILYHAIIAPQAGEILTDKQLKHAVDTLADNLGLSGHRRAVVEHRKAGRQHFHVVFNILGPDGKQARLQWTRKKEWATGRQLEQELGLKPNSKDGYAARRWEHERGKRSGIDPLKVRKEVTAIYRTSKTGKEFVAALDKAGYVLSRGRNDSYVIVDKAGHVHGLMRRIDGARLKDLREKFPDLDKISLPPLELVQKTAKAAYQAARKAKRPARNGYRPVPRLRSSSFRPPKIYGGMTAYRSPHALRAAYEDRKAAFRAMAAAFVYRKRPEKSESDPRPVRPWRYNPDMSAAEIIAWAFKNGRLDILAMYGIFLPPDFFEP